MLKRFRYENWKKNHPSNIIEYLLSPVPRKVKIVNFIFQKIFRLNSEVPYMVHFTSSFNGDIKIGKDVCIYFANCGNSYFQGINGIIIGDHTIIAPSVKIISANHDKNDFHMHKKADPVIIGNKCWLGTNCVILPGVKLGDNVIVAAGSIVTKSFQSNVIIAGNPAKVIKSLE